MNRRFRGLWPLIVALILAACGGAQPSANPTPVAPAPAPAPADSKSQPGGPAADAVREIEHVMGKTEIKGRPQRIVTLTQDATDGVLALGLKPVGAVEAWNGDPWYDFLKEDLAGVQVVGKETQPNLEAIAALNPDLILGSKVRHEKVYE